VKAYPHVLARVYDQPWAITAAALEEIAAIVIAHLDGSINLIDLEARVAARRWTDLTVREHIADGLAVVRAQQGSYADRLGAEDVGGVRVIPLYGPIVQRAGLMSRLSGAVSLDELANGIAEGLADHDVGAILLDVHSPGGSVDGLTEFATWLRAQRDAQIAAGGAGKPIVAIANQQMTSAAYYVAAQCTEIVASPSASVGAIGTIALHMEHSKADEMAGEAYTLIASDPAKLWGNEFQPLSSDAREEIQHRVDAFARLFIADVAKGRGISANQVVDGYSGGAVFLASEALKAQMVDHVEPLDATIGRLAKVAARITATSRMRAERGAAAVTAEVPYIVGAAGSEQAEVLDGPIARHKTATTEEPWDGPANMARCPADEAHLSASCAWRDDAGDPDAKGSYKFNHHMVGRDGRVGAANLQGCSSGRAVLKGARGGTTIPADDKPGVWEHLAGHERDAGRDVPAWSDAAELPETAAGAPMSPARPASAERIAAMTRPAAVRASWAADLKERVEHGSPGSQRLPVGRRARRLPGTNRLAAR
jgi:signal peptide peptidase SppA